MSEDLALGEEILDQAIEHCRQGDYLQASALLDAILKQLDPPEGVRRLVLALQQEGCQPKAATDKTTPWEFKAQVGYDSNVTQGITASTLVVGSPDAPLELVVDDSYRPRSSRFVEAALQRNIPLPDHSSLTLKVMGRNYTDLSMYDQVQLNALWGGRMKTQWGTGNWAVERTELWLGGHYYHSSSTLAAHLPWLQDPQWRWTALLQHLSYHTQSEQNALVYQVGFQRHWRWKQGEMLLSAGWHWDKALGHRAGGDRSGLQLGMQAFWPLRQWMLSGRLSYSHWSSSEKFLPGLLDMQRRNRLVQWGLQGDYPLSERQSLHLGIQRRDSQDRIGLYSYSSWGISAGWTVRF